MDENKKSAMEEFIQSRQNPRVKSLMKLRDRAERKKLGVFAVEGLRELSRCVKLSDVEEIYYCPEFFKSPEHELFVKKIADDKSAIDDKSADGNKPADDAEEIVQAYLLSVLKSRPGFSPTLGTAVTAPPRRPRSFEEAGKMIKTDLDN